MIPNQSPQSERPLHRVDPEAFARETIAASKRHLLTSVVLTVVGGSALALTGYLPGAFTMAGIGSFLVLYNVFRIRAASRALSSTDLGTTFVRGQRRSHLVRGTVYLVGSPVLVFITAFGLASKDPGAPAFEWLLFGAICAFLAYGWVWWLRTLRRVRLWSTS